MDIDTNVPKNKFIFALLALFMFLLIFSLLPDNLFKTKLIYSKDNNEEALILLNKKLSKDYITAPSDLSNPESLPNWKKALYDSVDPTIITATRTKEQESIQKNLDDPNNLTAQVSKNAYAISTYIAQQGANIDQKTLDSISKNIADNSVSSMQNKVTIHTESEFKTTNKDDVITLKAYGNELSKNLFKVFSSGNKDNVSIVSDYLSTEDETILKKFDKEINSFKALRDSLLKMTVPKVLLPLHVREINMAENYINILTIFSKTNIDPLKTVVTMEEYRKSLPEFYKIITDYNTLFINKGVYFNSTEDGYMFFNEKMANIKTR